MSLTARLGGAIAGLSDSPLPPDVVHQARRALVNILATSVAGARHEGTDAIVRTALRLGGTGSVPPPGREERLDPYWAALATGFAAHVDDFDDTHLATVIHPGAATLAAAVGAAGYAAGQGRPVHDSLRAFALAMEVQLRFGMALGPAHYAAGWHTTGTCGVMGATVMAGLALRLPPDQLADALGVAASCTLGHREVFGSDGKAFHPGKAAVNGLLAVVAGARGIRSSDTVLEAPRGYFNVLSDDPAPEELLRDFGTRWLLLDLTYKPYPCGIVAHPAIDAAVELYERSRGQALRAVRVRCHPLVVDLMGNPAPETGLQARFSTVHAVASALLDGGFGLAHVTDEAANRPDIARLRKLVELQPDASLGRSEAALTLEIDTGETLTATVQAARGSIAAPLTDADLGRKARSLLELRLAPRAVGDILQQAWNAADSTSVTGVAGPARQADLRPWGLTSTAREDGPAAPAAGNTGDAGMTQRLCEFAAGTQLTDIPADVRHDCARTVANALATGVAAARHPEIARLAGALGELSPDHGGTQLATRDRLPVLWAALVNGMAIHIQDFDDTHLAADTHVGATVLPAALAAAELTGASGGLLLTGVAVGMEVALRVALGVVPAAFSRGWHVTSIVGRIGAAVAAGRILGLDASQLRSAVGLAATQADGVQAAFGSTVKSWHAGKAAADGLEAALLAAAGMTGPACPIEGRRGFLAIMTAAPRPDRVTTGLGESWECARLSFKPYACGVVAHPAIDAAIALHSALVGQPGAVAEVTAGVNPVVFDVMGITEPTTGLQGKFSVIHCVAAGLLDGYAGPRQFTDSRVRAADAQALRRVTRGQPDPGLAKDAAWVRVRLRDGSELRHDVLHATGSVDNPLTDEDIRMKAARGLGPAGAEYAKRLMDLAFDLERLPSVAPFLAAVAIPDPGLAAEPRPV